MQFLNKKTFTILAQGFPRPASYQLVTFSYYFLRENKSTMSVEFSMFVGRVLQERYHVVARIPSRSDRETYVARSLLAQTEQPQYILKRLGGSLQQLDSLVEGLAQLQSDLARTPNLAQLCHYWYDEEQLWLAYDYIDGESLALVLPPAHGDGVIALLAEIVAILQPYHAQGLAHGNLHLGQLIRHRRDDRLLITDWGLESLVADRPPTPTADLQALGEIAVRVLTNNAHADPLDDRMWPQLVSAELAELIERLRRGEPDLSIVPLWLELGKMMHQRLQDKPPGPEDLENEDLNRELNQLQEQVDHQLRVGDAGGAIATCQRLIALDPNPLYFHNRGIIYAEQLQEYGRAIQDYDTALSLKPGLVHVYKNRAFAHWQLGHLTAALEDYDRTIELLPNLAIGYWERATLHRELGHLAAALADFNTFQTFNPYHLDCHIARGDLYAQQEEWAAALITYEQAIELDPDFAPAYYHRGNCRAAIADGAGALADFDRALHLDDSLVAAYQRRGALHYHQGAVDLARLDYERALALQPTALLHCQYAAIAPAVAQEHLERALSLEPHLALAYSQRAHWALQTQNWPQALADYTQVLELEPVTVHVLQRRGWVRQKLGDYGGAAIDYERAAHLALDRGQQQEYERAIAIANALRRAAFQ